PFSSILVFLLIAAPWHILAALANPTRGLPGNLAFTLHPAAGVGHFSVPLPTDGNVHGWAWFYFVNEQLLRYLNLRVPRDYSTVPLYLFYGLCLIWLMPWSAFVFKAIGTALPLRILAWRQRFRTRALMPWERAPLLLLIWAAVPLLFFSLSTRQEYYVLPALPALCLLIAGWATVTFIRREDLGITIQPGARCEVKFQSFTQKEWKQRDPAVHGQDRVAAHKAALHCTAVLLAHLGLQIFAPVLSSAQLAAAIAPQLTPRLAQQPGEPPALIVIHQEYEYGSTLGFYLQRP